VGELAIGFLCSRAFRHVCLGEHEQVSSNELHSLFTRNRREVATAVVA
jgi:hypothetical protein